MLPLPTRGILKVEGSGYRMESCAVMQVLQYQLSMQQPTVPVPDIAPHYVAPPPYFAALPNAAEGAATCARRRKYAWWCVGCGALAAALGGLLAAAHILLRAYTASPHHLETVPAAVPAAMLVLTGVCIMSLARRRNRYSYMIKVVGACCLVCALTCVLVTITTTVIHMNKLQTLKFCEYTKLTRTCTCFSLPPDHHHGPDEEEGVRCVFEGVTDCGVVHGVLYWCLRGVFALSVTAVLVCIFSSMLAYQLLSHERKKMYWEQLELRCRSLYRPPAGAAVPRARPVQAQCACCQQCRQPQPAWDISLQHRFWAPGRIGNLYSPNPGTVRKASAWSWFPWPRTNSQRCRMGAAPQSGDSAYGFCDATGEPVEPEPPRPYGERPYPYQQQFGTVPRGALQPAGAFSRSTADFAAAGYREGCGEASGSFELQDGVWGPPPPYSPQGRGGSRHHLHQDPAATTLLHHHQVDLHRNSAPLHEQVAVAHTCSTGRGAACAGHAAAMGPQLAGMGPCQEMGRYQRESELAEAGRCNTLRGQLVPYGGCRRALGASAGELRGGCGGAPAECAHQVQDPDSECSKQGKENLAFQNDKHSPVRSSLQLDCRNQHTESEVYFADVSSCCNISLKADCCVNPNVSALVGTIENHPESTSGESDNGSFTLTRQQRPQPQTLGSKRRPRLPPSNEKSRIGDSARNDGRITDLNNSMRNSDGRIVDLNNSTRNNDGRIVDHNNSMRNCDGRIIDHNNSLRNSDGRIFDFNNSMRNCDGRIVDLNNSMRNSAGRIVDLNNSMRNIDGRMVDLNNSIRNSDGRIVDLNSSMRNCDGRIVDLNNSMRNIDGRMVDLNNSIRNSDGRIVDLNSSMRNCDGRIVDINNSMRNCDGRMVELNSLRNSDGRTHDLNSSMRNLDGRFADLNDTTRNHEASMAELNNSARNHNARIEELNHTARCHSQDMNQALREQFNRQEQLNNSIREQLNCSVRNSEHHSPIRMCENSLSDINSSVRLEQHSPIHAVRDNLNSSIQEQRRLSDQLNSSGRTEKSIEHSILDESRMSRGSPKIRNQNHPGLRKVQNHRSSPKESPLHPRQSSSDSNASHKNNPEFFLPPPPTLSPLSPGTEESLVSDEELERSAEVFQTESETLALGPDSQYEPVREVRNIQNEEFKPNHHHCYSDTNTMDSGWQSGSEKHVTD